MPKSEINDTDLLKLINADPAVGVMVISADGEIVWHSKNAPQVFGADPTRQYVGMWVTDIFREEFANERLSWIRQVARSGEPMRVSHLYQGDRLTSTIIKLDRDTEPPYVVVLSRRDRPRRDGLSTQAISRFVDLGPLSILSSRELEVLVLLGHGHSVPQTAAMLHRSPRTIEQHKSSIGRKLGSSAIADIARMVGEVGLKVNDLQLDHQMALRPEFQHEAPTHS